MMRSKGRLVASRKYKKLTEKQKLQNALIRAKQKLGDAKCGEAKKS